jgi:hypothetical protein
MHSSVSDKKEIRRNDFGKNHEMEIGNDKF